MAQTPSIYTLLAYYSWIVLFLVWGFSRLSSKQTISRPDRPRQILIWLLILAGFVLVFEGYHLGPIFGLRLTSQSQALSWLGLLLDLIGVVFAIWARLTIGRNWSNIMTIKEGHELVQSGPYALVRHPIYSGMLLAMLGTVMTLGYAISYLGFVFAFIAMALRTKSEDKLMAMRFPESHAAYRQQTNRLIPFVW